MKYQITIEDNFFYATFLKASGVVGCGGGGGGGGGGEEGREWRGGRGTLGPRHPFSSSANDASYYYCK